jgi:ribosomal protein S18 acetylase RimI-like enzyme
VPESGTARPLRVHELDTHACGAVNFEAAGLIVAEKDGRIVGYVHAGFGPDLPVATTPPFQLCHDLGSICLFAIEPDVDDAELSSGLILAAERYLAARGAKVIYAGGLFPLNPFYWGLYGGSEGSGILSGHASFHRAVLDLGYQPVSRTVYLEANLADCEPREPRTALIRRQTQLEFLDDAMPGHWWESRALGEFQITSARLLARSGGAELAHAQTWDMGWFCRADGQARVGLINLEVPAEHRRKGFGRFLLSEIFRRAREDLVSRVEVQTSTTNQAALSLYASLGFQPIDQATLYRLPADCFERTRRP